MKALAIFSVIRYFRPSRYARRCHGKFAAGEKNEKGLAAALGGKPTLVRSHSVGR
jgi:hypothetical protein